MDKIKAFLSNKWTQLVAWILVALGSAILILGGITSVDVASSIELVAGILTAIGGLVAFIAGKIKKQ